MTYVGQPFASPQEALEHHGVKGMKWGVRKKEPRAVNQKRVDRINAKADQTQKMIDDILAKPSKWRFIQSQNDQQVRELTKIRDRQRKAAKDISEGRRLTDSQRKAAKGAAIAAAVLAAYGTYKFVDSGQYSQLVKGKNFSWKRNADLAKTMDADALLSNVVKKINPDYGGIGTKMNCRRCTMAYEMNRRGFDVKATKSVSGTGQVKFGLDNAVTPGSNLPTGRWTIFGKAITGKLSKEQIASLSENAWGAKGISVPNANEKGSANVAKSIFDAIAKEPNGARGELGVGWSFGGGHSMAWEIVQGKPVIFDAQSGTKYDSIDSFAKLAGRVGKAGYTRLDNLNMNDEYLKRWLNNVG